MVIGTFLFAGLTTGFELPKNLPVTEFAAWYAVASAILNLDECITKG